MSQHPQDSGFTLIEVLVTIALMGVLMAFALSGWSSWAAARGHSGTAQEIQSLLRQTQQRAVTEGRSMCVAFDTAAHQYTVFRGACDEAGKVRVQGPFATSDGRVRLQSPSFTSSTSSGNTGVTFRARGSAWPGEVRIARTGAAKVYILRVEGLTGRVSLH